MPTSGAEPAEPIVLDTSAYSRLRVRHPGVLSLLALVAIVVACAPTAGLGDATDVARSPTATAAIVRPAAEPTFGQTGATQLGQVVSITDGDTIRVVIDGDEYRLRYIGIDTPESVAPNTPVERFALAASSANAALVEDEIVVLERDISETDRFDRLLRYVWLQPDGSTDPGDPDAAWRLVNFELVEAGLAEAVDYPPDTRYSDLFDTAESEARAAGRGMWRQ